MIQYNSTIFDLQAELCAAMSSPIRLRIVHILKDGPLCVNKIAEILGITQSTTSRHLSVLRNSGILISNRAGVDVFYQVANSKIVNICEMMREVLSEREMQRSEIFHSDK